MLRASSVRRLARAASPPWSPALSELGAGEGGGRAAGVGGVVGVPEPGVVARDEMIGVGRIDPHVVEVAVRPARDVAEAPASVGANDERAVRLVDPARVLRVYVEVGK